MCVVGGIDKTCRLNARRARDGRSGLDDYGGQGELHFNLFDYSSTFLVIIS